MDSTRRHLILAGGALALPRSDAAAARPVEPGASLRVLRWKRFVAGDEELWLRNTKKFEAQRGVTVTVESAGFEDIRPKSAVAAMTGVGPDIVLGWYDDPHLYADKLLRLTDVAEDLGARYGGWYDVCREYGMRDHDWIGLPMGANGGAMVYRKSHARAAGFEEFPTTIDKYLDFARRMHRRGTPVAHALGHATGDATTWCHWILWAHGGRLVDTSNRVAIESAETLAALEYVAQLYETFPTGTLSWLDSNNNRAFLEGTISCTNNAISIYYAAKHSDDQTLRAMAEDIDHADWPVGVSGRPAQLHQLTQAMVFKHCKHPLAAKEYLRFMMEKEQYEAWQSASLGYVMQPLKAFEQNSVWREEPAAAVFKNGLAKMRSHGHAGSLGPASAAAMADFIVVDMFAEAASKGATPRQAMRRAADRARRHYAA